MVESKGWNWETADESLWHDPSEDVFGTFIHEIYYILYTFGGIGYQHFKQQSAKDAADLVVCDNNSGAISEVIDYIEKM